ncbi:hypothetical protein HN803_06860 [candidate division WWE3 bacterium]|jgi:hypothetical protein|nr:hypothetical protein [Candidatus Scalindua sp.]MBT7350471.1 hypothetical protein [candidate division WWE3 bacterium]
MTRWKTASDKDDKSKGGIWFGNRYAGSDAGAKADIKSYETFQTQLGLMQTRMGEIGGEFDQREDFMSKQNFLENAGVNRDAMFNIGNAQNQAGNTGFASSGGAEQNTERTRAGFVDTLRGNAMSFAKDRFELGLQEKAETLGMQTNMLDLYANYQANRQNLEFDATDDFDINQAAGLT